MKKEIVFAAKFDTSDFDKSVESMQKKLKDIYAPADAVRAQAQTQQRLQQAGMGSPQASSNPDQLAKATQAARREGDLAIREQVKGQEQLGKLLVQRESTLEKLKKQQSESIKDSQKELELRKQIGTVEENNARIRETIKSKDQAINQALDVRQKYEIQSKSDYGKTPGDFAGAMGDFTSSGARPPSNAFSMAMGGFGLIGAAGIAASRFTGYGQRLESAKGSAVQTTTGQDLQDVYSGRSPFESVFTPERQAASGLAAQKESRNRWTDRLTGIGSAASLVGGIGVGAASLLGTPFTMGGSAAGLPLAGGMIAAGVAGLSSDRNRKGIFGGQEYDQLLSAQKGQDFRSSYEDLKNQDPRKRLTVEGFEANRDRNVRGQRMMGLSNEQFYGENGFMANTANAGFSSEAGLQMASSVIGAGGSGRMANSPLGLQMDRGGLNGASMLGSISGSVQAPEANKRAVISIMSEAFKTGLDSTEFAEENRKFTQAAAGIIGKTGASSEGDQDRLAGVLGQFLGAKTNQGVGNAQNDYEKFQERSSQTTGRRGAMRFSGAMQDPLLSKLSGSDLSELLSMRDEDLNENNPALGELAHSTGQKGAGAKDIIKSLQGVNKSARFIGPGQKDRMQPATDMVQKYMDENQKSLSDVNTDFTSGKLPENISNALGRMKLEMSKTDNASGITSGEGLGNLGELLKNGRATTDTKGQAKSSLDQTGRIEDAYTKKAAEGADEARKSFNSLTDELWKLIKGTDALKESTTGASKALSDAASQNLQRLPQGSATNADVLKAITAGAHVQPQSNKPKGQ